MAKTKLTKQMIQDCYEWVRENGLIDNGGAKFVDFCNAMCIDQRSFYRWLDLKDNPLAAEFADAIKKAKEEFKDSLVKDLVVSLAKSAKGYRWQKKRTEYKDVNGKPQIVKQIVEDVDVPPNTGAAIFLLTNIAPDKWKNKQYIDSRETKETKIKVDSDAEILDEIPADVLADITETLQLALQKEEDNGTEYDSQTS